MDDEQNTNQHTELFKLTSDHEKRLVRIEVHQENLLSGHDEHKEQISKNSDLLMKISIGGIVLFMAAEQLGLLDKLQ